MPVWVGHSCPTSAYGLSEDVLDTDEQQTQNQKRRTRASDPHAPWL